MSVAIRILGLADGRPTGLDGEAYVEHYDPDGGPNGVLNLTTDPARAMRFASTAEALELWRRQSTTVPLRDDGKPNRPLTAFTVEIAALREENHD